MTTSTLRNAWTSWGRRVALVAILATTLTSATGCAYFGRLFRKFGDDLYQTRVDFDRTLFDLEEKPVEEDY